MASVDEWISEKREKKGADKKDERPFSASLISSFKGVSDWRGNNMCLLNAFEMNMEQRKQSECVCSPHRSTEDHSQTLFPCA